MAKKIDTVDFIEFTEDDQSMAPARWRSETGQAGMVVHFFWSSFVFEDEPDVKYFYQRSFYPGAPAGPCGIIRPCNDMSGYHERLYISERLPKGGIAQFETIGGDPTGLSSDKTSFKVSMADCSDFVCNLSSKGLYVREGDIMEMTFRYFPKAIMLTKESVMGVNYTVAFGEVSGILEGRKIAGIGGSEMAFVHYDPNASFDATVVPASHYYHLVGKREDGRHEIGFVVLRDIGAAGAGSLGTYWLEGEEEYVVTDEVLFHADWEKLPGVDDGSVWPLKVDLKFGGKEAHFTSRNGFRGFVPDPYKAETGFSNAFGTFYFGDQPYQHTFCHSAFEMQHIVEGNMRPNDF